MAAGESAYDVARRQREKAERLQRSAEMWERGAEGEAAVARALEALPEGWVVLHDLAWPGRQRANLDHVVVGPGGVFVVDAKNWSGRVEVRDQVLMQNGRKRETTVVSAAEAALAVQRVLPPPASCAGVLCFVRDEPITGWSRDVMVCSSTNVVTMLLSRPTVLSPEDVRRSAEAVQRATAQRTPRSAAPRATSSRAATPRRPMRRSKRRPLLPLVGGVALFAAVATGGFQKAADWAGEQFVGVVAPADSTDPVNEPVKRKKQQRQQQQ